MEECACVQRGLTSSGKVKLIKFIGIISPNAPTCLAKSFYVQKGLGPTIYGQLTTNLDEKCLNFCKALLSTYLPSQTWGISSFSIPFTTCNRSDVAFLYTDLYLTMLY